jgi:hypothetical protein
MRESANGPYSFFLKKKYDLYVCYRISTGLVELRQQPSSQGQQAAWGRPEAEPQLVPLLLFTVGRITAANEGIC